MSIPYKKQLKQLCIYLLLVPLASLLPLKANSLDAAAALGQNMVSFSGASDQLDEQLVESELTDESYKSYQLLEALRTLKGMIDEFATNTGSMNLENLGVASKLVEEALELEVADIPSRRRKKCCSTRVILCQIQQLINTCCATIQASLATGFAGVNGNINTRFAALSSQLTALSGQLAAGIATLASSISASTTTLSAAISSGTAMLSSDISSSTGTIITEITSKLPCTAPVPITIVPFTITASGEYCLTGNMTYTGVGGAAITVLGASDVIIELNGFNITVTDPTASGILIQNSTNVTVRNDNIILPIVVLNPAATNGGIQVLNSSGVTLDSIFTVNGQNGIVVNASGNVDIINSSMSVAANAGVNIISSTEVVVERTTLSGNNFGILFSASGNANCRIIDTQIPTSLSQDVLANQVGNLIIDRCIFGHLGTSTPANLVQLGNVSTVPATTSLVTNASIRNSLFLTLPTDLFVEGLVLTNVSGALVEDCLISVFNSSALPDLPLDLSGIHLSSPPTTTPPIVFGIAQDCKIVNCIFAGSPQDSVYPDQGSVNIEISNCLIGGAVKNGILYDVAIGGSVRNNTIQFGSNASIGAPGVNGIHLLDTSGVTVDNNVTSHNTGDGILIDNSTAISIANVIRNNIASDNTINGITLGAGVDSNVVINNQALANGANGILVGANALSNIVEGNQASSNTVNGIQVAIQTIPGPTANFIQNNQTVDNGGVGILDSNGIFTTSFYFDNTSAGNAVNYSLGIQATVAQGNPALAGQNVHP
jgi:parallel beta-helix repeat protein